MGERPKIVEKLPVHSSRGDKDTSSHVIRVDGLVGKKLELKIADLERLPQENLTDDFTCLEGWTIPGVRWTGVSLAAALSAAEPKPEARYVQIAAGEFGVSIDREVAERALLAIRVGDSILPPEHGGPVRLVVPGGECFTSIKWVDHIELRAEPGEDSAKKIALGRLPSRTPGKQ